MTNVTYYFDPVCPFTWYTTKWLRQVEGQLGTVNVHWRPFSLLVLNGDNVNEKYAAPMKASHNSLRLIEALRKDDQQDKIIEFYEWVGVRHHEQDAAFDDALVKEGVEAVGLSDYASAIDETSWDDVVEKSTNAAISAAGPDIGSPVITFEGYERGFHGPVVELEDMPLEESMKVWTVLNEAVTLPKFYEIKRGRSL